MSVKPADPRGGHVRLYWSLLDSVAWNCLAATDQRAYIALVRNLRATNNGDLSLTLTQARHHGIRSQTTLAKSLRALVAVGLLDVTRRGGCQRGGQRLPTLYGVTSEEVYEMSKKPVEARRATNAWRNVSNIAHGKRLIRDAEGFAKDAAAKKRNQGQDLSATAPENGSFLPINGPGFGSRGRGLVQSLEEASIV